jgi:leucyl-tRNA synthetase
MIRCEKCGYVPVPEADLPVVLPQKVEFTGAGESPLLTNPEWISASCPQCGGPGKREADTMDTFVCSSWYYLRYPNPAIDSAAFDKDLVAQWLPVDQYVGGAEHAVMHLLYARFFTKVLHSLGLVPFDEPFTRLVHQGVITNKGAKMSKSRGNVINPDPYLEKYGSDVFRLYLMFMGTYTEGGDWSDEGIHGIQRFVNRIWRLAEMLAEHPPSGDEKDKAAELDAIRHNAVKSATLDLDRFQFNTAISRIMELVNAMYLYIQDVRPEDQNRAVFSDVFKTLIRLLAPFAPHMADELWHRSGNGQSVFLSAWPIHDEAKLKKDSVTLVVQVNGKVRGEIQASVDSPDDAVKEAAMADPKVRKYLDGTIIKVIVVKNKLVSIAVKPNR